MKTRYYTARTDLYFRGWAVHDRQKVDPIQGPKPIGLFFSRRKARKVAKLLNMAEAVGRRGVAVVNGEEKG